MGQLLLRNIQRTICLKTPSDHHFRSIISLHPCFVATCFLQLVNAVSFIFSQSISQVQKFGRLKLSVIVVNLDSSIWFVIPIDTSYMMGPVVGKNTGEIAHSWIYTCFSVLYFLTPRDLQEKKTMVKTYVEILYI